jgi:hypothetical protein
LELPLNIHSYIHFLAFIKIGFKIAYRTVQGIVRRLLDHIRIEEIYISHIRRRIIKIKPSSVGNLGFEEEHDKPIMLIADASGLTISKRKVIIFRRRNGYVGKKSLLSCI